MSELKVAWESLKFGGAMVYPLLFLAVLALVLMLDKAFVYWRYVRLPASLLDLVETYGFAWSELERMLATLDLSARTQEEVRSFIGKGIPNLVQRCLQASAGDARAATVTFEVVPSGIRDPRLGGGLSSS